MKTKEISNSDDVIDSRDIIARIDELQAERDALSDARDEAKETLDDFSDAIDMEEREAQQEKLSDAETALTDWDESDEGRELKALTALQEEAEGYASDWRWGAALIAEHYFPDYCQELCEDIGDLPKDLPHYIVIDWERTAENIKADYTEVDFDGTTYLIR